LSGKIIFFKKRRHLGAFLVLLALSACDDFGVRADFFEGEIRGELQISTVVPDTTEAINVAISKIFPPSSVQDLIFSEVIPIMIADTIESQTVSFDLQVPLGEYGGVFVSWKAKNQSRRLTDIVGVYGNLERLELNSVVLTEEDPVAENVIITVDLSRVGQPSSISGHIDFTGEWPDNTQIVALVVYRDFTDFGKIPPGLIFIPEDSEQFDYRVGLLPDTYNFVVVAWLPIGDFDLNKLRLLGVYENPPGSFGQVVVPDSTDITGIDIVADFANINL